MNKEIILLLCAAVTICKIVADKECWDLKGRLISNGMHYVPGPEICSLCVCDNGEARACKPVLCSAPVECRSFRLGATCCEYICLDDVVKPEGESKIRVAAGGAAVGVLLTVALVVFGVRRQKRRRTMQNDDHRSLTSIGYISGSAGYMGGTCETALAAWKPPGHYLPRGEAPPPYDEAVEQCRQDNLRYNMEPTCHRTFSAVDSNINPEELQCTSHSYVNMPRPVQLVPNPQSCFNAPLLQPASATEACESVPMPYHPLATHVVGYPNSVRLTGSLGAISNRGLLSVLQRDDRDRPPPALYTAHTSFHRTIPRITTATDNPSLDAGMPFCRGERSLHNEIRRSFHKPNENIRHHSDTGRSMPRNLNLVANADVRIELEDTSRLKGKRSRAHSEEGNIGGELFRDDSRRGRDESRDEFRRGWDERGDSRRVGTADSLRFESNSVVATMPNPLEVTRNTLPLTVDKPSCVCSYETSATTGGEETDDYRNECENCKATNSSIWVTEDSVPECNDGVSQTVQRRPPPPAPPPSTATLPQPVTRLSRNLMSSPPSNWDNWLNNMHETDSESEEE